jgi:hypothetical protein
MFTVARLSYFISLGILVLKLDEKSDLVPTRENVLLVRRGSSEIFELAA